MKIRVSLFLAFFISLSGIAFAQEIPVTASVDTQRERGYLVGPGDVITAKVLGEPQFDFVAAIDEDGKFQVPFFDKSIDAKCRTEKQLRASVSELLAKFLQTPQVSVSVTERKSRPPATIYGEVRKAGEVDLRRNTTLIELLAFSGGVTEDAGGMIQVFRTQPLLCSENEENPWAASGNGTEVPSRMYSLSSVKQGRAESNPAIYPGDIIVVQKAAAIYINGEVVQPIGIRLPEGGLSLMQAIAMVGGVNRTAKTKDIKIYRLKGDSKDRETISVNYDTIKKGQQKDVMLEPYDIVLVDKAKKSIAQVVFETLTGAAKTVVGQTLPARILY